jgi:small redox-active disulfide protein 2
MKVKILGPGCINCKTLYERTAQALKELNIEAQLEKVEKMEEITKYIMMTPGLVIDEKVVHSGKPLPDVAKIKKLIEKATTA